MAWDEAAGVDRLRLPGPPGAPEPKLRLAHQRALDGDLRGALELYRRAIDAQGDPHPWLGLGALALALGDLNAAGQAFRSYVARASQDPRGWANLAETELRRDDLGAAARALSRARELPAEPELSRRIDALHRGLIRRMA